MTRLLTRYQREANTFSSIPDADGEGREIDDKGRNVSNEHHRRKSKVGGEAEDGDLYENAVDAQVEGEEADEGGANVATRDRGLEQSEFGKSDSLLSDADDEFGLLDPNDDGPVERPDLTEEPPDERVEYGDEEDDGH